MNSTICHKNNWLILPSLHWAQLVCCTKVQSLPLLPWKYSTFWHHAIEAISVLICTLNMHWNKNTNSYIWIFYTYMFTNSKGNELWPTVDNSTPLHTRSDKDVILHKKWDKVENFYRKVQQEHVLDDTLTQAKHLTQRILQNRQVKRTETHSPENINEEGKEYKQ